MFHKFIPRVGEEDPIFNPPAPNEQGGEQGINLADLILEKIAAYEAAQAGRPAILGGGPPEDAVEIPAKAIEVYQKYVILPRLVTQQRMALLTNQYRVGLLLSRYKSGPLSKPFKILPTLPQWS